MSCIKLDKFLCCFSLRKGILLSVLLNSLLCTLLLLLYIPYSLNWSPVRKQIEAQKNGEIALDFDWKIFDSTLVIIILFLLLTDLFLLVGVRDPHKPSLELVILWLSVYLLVIPGLTVMAVVLVHLTGLAILAVLVCPASLYLYLWLAVYSYYSQCSQANNKDDGGEDNIKERKGSKSCNYRLVPRDEGRVKVDTEDNNDLFVEKDNSNGNQVKNR